MKTPENNLNKEDGPNKKLKDVGTMQPDKGIQQSYKNIANSSANVMFRAKVKGHTSIDGHIPLHTTLKTFDKPHLMPHEEIKNKVKELGIQRPDPDKLQYEPMTFKSPRSGDTYYMLKLHGADPSYEKFANHFKGQGISHDKFMSHITINKELYDKIKKEGIKPGDIEFSPLMIEHGANNPTHVFEDNKSNTDSASDITPKKLNPIPDYKKSEEPSLKKEELEKGALKHIATTLGVVGALASQTALAPTHSSPEYTRNKMLNTISQVESSGGKDTSHKAVGGLHHGESAYGKYAIMPNTIRETIKMNRDLKSKHGKAAGLMGQELHNYMEDHPGLDRDIADRHLARLEHHFGNNPILVGYGWNQGVNGTHKALNEKKDIGSHPYSQKIKEQYLKEK